VGVDRLKRLPKKARKNKTRREFEDKPNNNMETRQQEPGNFQTHVASSIPVVCRVAILHLSLLFLLKNTGSFTYINEHERSCTIIKRKMFPTSKRKKSNEKKL
jgi:hypothetical protein